MKRISQRSKGQRKSVPEVMDKPPEISESLSQQPQIILPAANYCKIAYNPDDDEVEAKGETEKTPTVEEEESKKISFKDVPVRTCANGPTCAVENYFVQRRIQDLFEFMCQHLLVALPDEPTVFLKELMEKCLLFRADRFEVCPLIFEPVHIASVVDSFDLLRTGSLTPQAYHEAMTTLGVKVYNKNPEVNPDGTIPKEVFVANTRSAMVEDLRDMLAIPPEPAEQVSAENKVVKIRKEITEVVKLY